MEEVHNWHLALVAILIFGGGGIYVVSEMLLGSMDFGYDLFDLFKDADGKESITASGLRGLFPYFWLAVACFGVALRFSVIVSSYLLSKKRLGRDPFAKYLLTYFSSFSVGIGFSLLVLLLITLFLQLLGVQFSTPMGLISDCVAWLEDFARTNVPTLIQVNSYWLALSLSIILGGLPNYVIHLLSHKFRLFWLVFHRPHHCPDFLHPMGAPPAFVFEVFLTIPSVLISITVSALIFPRPLVMEMILWKTFSYCFEIFNHSLVHYKFALTNPIIRNISRVIGDNGVYHLVHHSAKPNDQTINLGGGPFLIWNRVFGTYRRPYEQEPPVGLTNQPKIILNPFRIIFSGMAQMLYELKHNKNWMVRMKVIFGSIYYIPPRTKEYLILSK